MEPILVNNIPYICELRRPWYTYGNGLIELDHKDGKHNNNTVKNIQPLCKICHGIKTDQQQDKSSIIKELEKKENADGTDLTFQETINRYDRRFETDSTATNFIAILNKNTFNEIKRKYYLLKNDKPEPCYKTINKIWKNEIEPVPLLSEEEYNKLIGDEVIIRDKQLELQLKDENKIGVNNDYGKLENEMNPSPAQIDLLAEQVAIQNTINEVDIAAEAIKQVEAFKQNESLSNALPEDADGLPILGDLDQPVSVPEEEEVAAKLRSDKKKATMIRRRKKRDAAVADATERYNNRVEDKKTLMKLTKDELLKIWKDETKPDMTKLSKPIEKWTKDNFSSAIVMTRYPRIIDPYPQLADKNNELETYLWLTPEE